MRRSDDKQGLLSEEVRPDSLSVNEAAVMSLSRERLAEINRMSMAEVESEIKQAYRKQDNDMSRALHRRKNQLMYDATGTAAISPIPPSKRVMIQTPEEESYKTIVMPTEKHKELGDFVKSIIYGGLDGIITTFAVVASVHGANLKPEVILVLGFANLAADGMAMGIGDYLSEQAEMDFAKSERSREQWEFDCSRESEINEMIEIYEREHGVPSDDARTILETMAKYPDLFIDHMMVQELGLNPPDPEANPAMNGLFTLVAFLCFGAVPLLSYLVAAIVGSGDKMLSFELSVALTLTCMALLGAFKAKLTESSYLRSMGVTVFNGGAAAGVSYVVGFALSRLVNTSKC